MKKRQYKSLVRQRQADDTRRRIVEAARQLLQREGYAGMTIEAIAQRAEVSAQSVYAIFKSKTGILIALLDQSMFGSRLRRGCAGGTERERSRNPFAARGPRR